MKLLALLLALLIPLPSFAGDAPDTTKPVDIEHMRAIGAALQAYKKAKGEFPDHLSDLVPAFLDAKTLVSPLGVDADPRAVAREYDPQLPCTYCYEFGTNDFLGRGVTFRALKTIQLQEYGPTLPILRCFIYNKALNLSHAGDFFETDFNWEWDPETERLIKKNGYGPGAQTGKKLIVTLTDETGHPVPGVAVSASNRSCFNLPLPDRPFTADADGKVTIPLGVDKRSSVYFGCSDKGWFLGYRNWRFGDEGTPPNGDTATITVVLNPAATVGGIVRNSQGEPVAKASVFMSWLPDPRDPDRLTEIAQTETDSQGAWTPPGIPTKNIPLYLFICHASSRALRGKLGAAGVPEAAALFSGHAEIRLAPPFSVKGRVLFGEKPVPLAKVYLFGATVAEPQTSAVTDAEGQFEFLGESEGHSGYFIVIADQLAPKFQSIDLAADAKPSELKMDAGRTLKGRLLRGQHIGVAHAPILFTGFPAKGFGVPLPVQPVIATSDAEGNFIWEHAPREDVSCNILFPEGGDPWEVEWDATKNQDMILHLER